MLLLFIILLFLFCIVLFILSKNSLAYQYQSKRCNKMKCIPSTPVCGSNGVIYDSACSFGQASCKDSTLKIVRCKNT